MSDTFSLENKNALITGASRGIGADVAVAMAEAGANVAVLYRSRRDEAEKTVAEVEKRGRRSACFQQDMGDLDSLEKTLAAVVDFFGQVDILVNNAGIADLVKFDEVDRDLMERTLRVNVMGPFFLMQAVGKHMIENGIQGRIVNVTSTNGFVAEALLSPYNASKGAMEMLTKSFAIELGPYKINVNSVAPGIVGSEIAMDFPLKPEFWEYTKEHIPLGYLGDPADVAGAIVFLSSGAARYITGQHIIVDGGLLADQFPRMQFYKGKQ